MNFLQQAALAERTANASKPRVRPVTECVIKSSTHGLLHELGIVAVRRKEIEAIRELQYWQGNKARALTDKARNEAAARIAIWQMELTAIRKRLAELSTSDG